ncbi:MAG: heavy-metal-associated domain-containing protein [gamma proteobacterium symbiont of Bathyaustriella thionipta]|nr:heavy-metal-associated domain-containing protein [gamma proteobacterium symbiont of Bathyaustriella thionipta]
MATDNSQWIFRHAITIPGLMNESQVHAIHQHLAGLKGIQQIDEQPDKHRLRVSYDVRVCSYQEILQSLQKAAIPVSEGMWQKLRNYWFQFTDANTRDNARLPVASCCNKPPAK